MPFCSPLRGNRKTWQWLLRQNIGRKSICDDSVAGVITLRLFCVYFLLCPLCPNIFLSAKIDNFSSCNSIFSGLYYPCNHKLHIEWTDASQLNLYSQSMGLVCTEEDGELFHCSPQMQMNGRKSISKEGSPINNKNEWRIVSINIHQHNFHHQKGDIYDQ